MQILVLILLWCHPWKACVRRTHSRWHRVYWEYLLGVESHRRQIENFSLMLHGFQKNFYVQHKKKYALLKQPMILYDDDFSECISKYQTWHYFQVERHIRLLDQAIKEQEAESLSLNSSNGASIHLPDLVIPSRSRNARVRTISDNQNISINLVDSSSDIDGTDRGSQLKGGGDYREMSGKRNGASANSGKDSAALTITLPATQPSEELYCYCNRVSFGKVSYQATSQLSFTVYPLDDRVW